MAIDQIESQQEKTEGVVQKPDMDEYAIIVTSLFEDAKCILKKQLDSLVDYGNGKMPLLVVVVEQQEPQMLSSPYDGLENYVHFPVPGFNIGFGPSINIGVNIARCQKKTKFIILNDDLEYSPIELFDPIVIAMNSPGVHACHYDSTDWNGWCFVIDEFFLREIGLFDCTLYPCLYEDTDLYDRVVRNGIKHVSFHCELIHQDSMSCNQLDPGFPRFSTVTYSHRNGTVEEDMKDGR